MIRSARTSKAGGNMKISVITLHTVKNYGSVLQTYATQKKLEQMGARVEFVDYWRENTLDRNVMHESLNGSGRWNRNPLTRLAYRAVKYPSIRKRVQVFNGFLQRYIHLTPERYLSLEELEKRPPKADLYCTGSDQVWNSEWNGGIEKPYFLEYAPEGGKCFAYAASFGKEKLDPEEQKTTKTLLQKYSAISMRESSGVRILNEMGIRGGVQILDPTLVLEANEWKKLMSPRRVRQKYLLIYQLNKNRGFDRYARRLARAKGLKLIRLSYDYHHIVKSGRLVCCPSVETWLSLFYHADYVVTDSFHGTAFSINFNKQFAVFYPSRFGGRLESILKLTGLENRVVADCGSFAQADRSIDYRPVERILTEERKKADAFLTEALKIQETDGETE